MGFGESDRRDLCPGAVPQERLFRVFEQLLTNIGQWTVESDFSPKIHAIISRLVDLKKEEEARDKAHKAVVDAEKTYYRSLYKNYPRSEVEILERSCRDLKDKSKATDIQFQNSTATTLNHCLNIFFNQLATSCDANKAYADKVLSVLNAFEDSLTRANNVCYTSDQENNDNEATNLLPEQQKENENPTRYQRIANLMSGKRNSLKFDDIFSQASQTTAPNHCSPTLPLEPQKKSAKSTDDRESDILDFNNPAYNHFESSPSLNNRDY
jgi:hypothetical protein